MIRRTPLQPEARTVFFSWRHRFFLFFGWPIPDLITSCFWFIRPKLISKVDRGCDNRLGAQAPIHRSLNNSQPSSHSGWLYLLWPFTTPGLNTFRLFVCCFVCCYVFLFVCLFVGIKPEKLYSAFCVGGEVYPLGVVTHGQRHKQRACQRQRYKPRTCQTTVMDDYEETPALSNSGQNSDVRLDNG